MMNATQTQLEQIIQELPLDEQRKIALLKMVAADGSPENMAQVIQQLRQYAQDLQTLASLMEQQDLDEVAKIAREVSAIEAQVAQG